MEAPKCKLCGERHYGMCPQPKYDRKEDGPSVIPFEELPIQTPETAIDPYWVKQIPREADFPAKPKYDRNAAHRAYMKEYMRKRRAKEREK